MLRATKTMTLTAREFFAEHWFLDALVELEQEGADDVGARRRQILFGACCAECYLVEWARELLMTTFKHGDLVDQLQQYFPKPDPTLASRMASASALQLERAHHLIANGDIDSGLALVARANEQLQRLATVKPQNAASLWQSVPLRLYEEGFLDNCISQPPGSYSKEHAKDFQRLIEIRNAVTHGGLSRPHVLLEKGKQLPPPRVSSRDLLELERGWALRVVATRLVELHANTNTPEPRWFDEFIYEVPTEADETEGDREG